MPEVPTLEDVQTRLLIILDRISVHPALFDTPMDLMVLPLKHDGVDQDGADLAELNSPSEDTLTCTVMRKTIVRITYGVEGLHALDHGKSSPSLESSDRAPEASSSSSSLSEGQHVG